MTIAMDTAPQSAPTDHRIRDQYEKTPYPNIPLEQTPAEDANYLLTHSLVNANYIRHQQVIGTEGKVILDAGCGSGYKALALAIANPGAKIIGVDLSPESVKVAEQRLQHHGFEHAEFYAISIEDLAALEHRYDYINCDEVLYLLPDPVKGLQVMQSVLNPGGVIRANFHSAFQRGVFFRGQMLCGMLGLMNDAPDKEQVGVIRSVMQSLKPGVMMKQMGWHQNFNQDDGGVLVNYLLQGDKGWTVPEFFSALQLSNLEFIRMVNWRQWDLTELFESWDDLPVDVVFGLSSMSEVEQLHFFELLHPFHRLLDLWCGHPGESSQYQAVEEWTEAQWQQATFYLNPLMVNDAFKQALYDCIRDLQSINLSCFLKSSNTDINATNNMAVNLVLLLEGPQTMKSLAQRWLRVNPVDPVTLEPTDETHAYQLIQQFMIVMEKFGYVMATQPQ